MMPLVLLDFDGTIVQQDATDLILERFALPQWREVESEWVAGRIGSRECLARQIDLVRMTESELTALIASLDIDPGFPAFATLCRDLGYAVAVGSDGLDRVIAATLKRAGTDLPFFSNRLVQNGADRWRVEFPHFRDNCEVASGACKCAIATPGSALAVLVGDGRSDFCAAAEATWVLAKGALARHCTQAGIPHTPIDGFADAPAALRAVSHLIPRALTRVLPTREGAEASHA